MVKFSRYPRLGIFFTILIIALSVKFFLFANFRDAIFIVSLCIILFAFGITYSLDIILNKTELQKDEKRLFFTKYKYELGLALVLIITTLPLLTRSYFYYDDWAFVGNKTFPCKPMLFIFGRPIQTLYFSVFDNINITNAYIIKWALLFAMILYSLVLFRWLLHLTQNERFAFLLASILSIFAPAMDLLGYSASGAITFSFLFSSLSVISYQRAYEAWQQRVSKKIVTHTVISILLLFTACLVYQIGPQIIFLFMAMEIFFTSKPALTIKKHFIYFTIFAFSYGFYLIFITGMTKYYDLELTIQRAQLINSLEQIEAKFYFYQHIIKQSVMQVGTALSGNVFIVERYHGYNLSYSNALGGNLIYRITIIVVLIAFVAYIIKSKNILAFLTLIAYIPMSYFSFLILTDNAYLTYYAFPHISVLMFFFIMGLIALSKLTIYLIQKFRPSQNASLTLRINNQILLIPILILCAVNSNHYVRDFYVNYNTVLYDFVKDSIQTALESDELERIHIAGTISPLNADVYSMLVVQTALTDLGENIDEYNLTYSANLKYLERIEEFYYLNLTMDLSTDERMVIDSFYQFDPTYSQYNITRIPSEQEETTLNEIFVRAGAIPQYSTAATLLIDLTWTDQAYYNTH